MMIDINQIQQIGNSWLPTLYNYRFPTIDFNFQNTGRATASLWQFAITILEAEIDQTPALNFKTNIEGDELNITATNNGWGTAFDCQIQIDEPLLNRLFTNTERQYRGDISSGDTSKILSLKKEATNFKQFEALRKEFKNIFNFSSSPPFQRTIEGIRLGTIDATWMCKDTKGDTYQGQERIQGFDQNGDYIITENGFFKTSNPRSGGGGYSDVTYGAVIDPLKGNHERTYIFRRKIPSGDTERFHIMIGSPMSCHLRVKFKFFVDEAKIIESKEFNIEIWNPRNSEWHYPYRDGEELRRDIEQQKADITKYSNDRDKEAAFSSLEKFQQQTSNYPFIKQEKLDS